MKAADPAEIVALLESRVEQAMFPLANLREHGTDGHPRSMRFRRDGDAVLGVSAEGMVMPIWDGDAPADLRAALAGRRIRGVIGEAAAARSALQALGLLNSVDPKHLMEPQFVLELADLIVPYGPGKLEPLDAWRDAAISMRAAYDAELALPSDPASVDRWIKADSHRLLVADGEPIALTGFNACLPHIVQIGGVYVPPDLRGRGLAGRAVALHLEEARSGGIVKATLFAASKAAARAYIRLGFVRIGSFALALLPSEQEVIP